MYSEFLDDWLNVFPRDQMLLLRNEDYKVAQQQHMDAVFKFLGEYNTSYGTGSIEGRLVEFFLCV
jgi:hypothetical protein